MEIDLIPMSDKAKGTADISQVFFVFPPTFIINSNVKFQLKVNEDKDVTFPPPPTDSQTLDFMF